MDLEGQLQKAPKEVKQKMCAASAAAKRYQKAVAQVKLWHEEQSIAASLQTAAQSDWSECLNRWDPETNILAEKQELHRKKDNL